MAGIDLKEMEASDMLDVLHYLLDEDLSFSSGEEAKYKSSLRATLYKTIYNQKYKFDVDGTKSSGNFDEDTFPDAGLTREVKPYIPPTNFDADAANPFQGTLRESPLG